MVTLNLPLALFWYNFPPFLGKNHWNGRYSRMILWINSGGWPSSSRTVLFASEKPGKRTDEYGNFYNPGKCREFWKKSCPYTNPSFWIYCIPCQGQVQNIYELEDCIRLNFNFGHFWFLQILIPKNLELNVKYITKLDETSWIIMEYCQSRKWKPWV